MKEALSVQERPAESRLQRLAESPANHISKQLLPYVVFEPGLGATRHAMLAGIHRALVNELGEENVTTASAEVSSDTPDKEQLRKLAGVIMNLAPIRKVGVVMHSLGSTAVMYIKKIIEKIDEKFFDNQKVKENLHFIKIGESGSSRGPISRIKYLWNVLRNNRRRDTKALYAFPPEGVKQSDITTVYSSRSNKRSDIQTEPFTDAETHDAFLTEKEKDFKEANDAAFGSAVADGKFSMARRLAIRRGRKLKGALQRVFEGAPDSTPPKRWYKLGGFRGVRTLLRALGSKPMRELQELYDKGYTVDSLVSEFDNVVPEKQSSWFYRSWGKARAHTRIMEGSPHDGPGLQWRKWARVIKGILTPQVA